MAEAIGQSPVNIILITEEPVQESETLASKLGNYLPDGDTVKGYLPDSETVQGYLPDGKTVRTYLPDSDTVKSYFPDPQTVSNVIGVPKKFMEFISANNAWLKKLSNWDAKVRFLVLPSQVKNLFNQESLKSSEGVSSLSEVALNISKQTGWILGKSLPTPITGALNVGAHAKTVQDVYENRAEYAEQIKAKIGEMSEEFEKLDSTQKTALVGGAAIGSAVIAASCIVNPALPVIVVIKTYQGYKLAGVIDSVYQTVAEPEQESIVKTTASNWYDRGYQWLWGSEEKKPEEAKSAE
ncbi:MAG: hypothetical protein K940chlam8_00361 [Chlamydiae bacterium]|nr:hypothetical protein [Chlamydiota bacterium]